MGTKRNIRISTQPDDLKEGLFGQIFLHMFELLPYLEEKGIYPAWEMRSKLYGMPEDFVVIPGLLELNYEAGIGPFEEIDFLELRYRQAVVLGGDWEYVAKLWGKYFRWPSRVRRAAEQFPDLSRALGLHFRGTDKNQSLVETNAVTQEDFLTLARDFVRTHPDIETIFVASDETAFVEKVKQQHPQLKVIDSGAGRLSSTVGSEAWNSRDLKSRPH